jgi:hypothetical protein
MCSRFSANLCGKTQHISHTNFRALQQHEVLRANASGANATHFSHKLQRLAAARGAASELKRSKHVLEYIDMYTRDTCRGIYSLKHEKRGGLIILATRAHMCRLGRALRGREEDAGGSE